MAGRKSIRMPISKLSDKPSPQGRGSKRITQRVEENADKQVEEWQGLDLKRGSETAAGNFGEELPEEITPAAGQAVDDTDPDPDPETVADLVIQIVGDRAVGLLASNTRLQIPMPADVSGKIANLAVVPRDWLRDLMRSVLSQEGIAELQSSLEAVTSRFQSLSNELSGLRKEWHHMERSYQTRLEELERQRSDSQRQLRALREQAQGTIAVTDLMDRSLRYDGHETDMRRILSEVIDEPVEGAGSFVSAVCLGWLEVRAVLERLNGDEERRMEAMLGAMSAFMCQVSGIYVPQRRELLKRVGNAVSAYFEDYDFVSPEDWRQIDPAVHKAEGVGGQYVKEGRSYVVLRRNTRQTVIYAEIMAE